MIPPRLFFNAYVKTLNALNLCVVVTCIVFACFPRASISSTFYVSQTGNNANSGLSWQTSWRTLRHAGANAAAGNTVIIRKGEHPYKFLPILNSGTPSSPIIFKGELENSRPIITGAKRIRQWENDSAASIWSSKFTYEPRFLLEDGHALTKATSPACLDGNWYWHQSRLYYKPAKGIPVDHEVWASFAAGGAIMRSRSWIELHNLEFWIGGGAGVSMINSHNIKLYNISAEWHWTGINISNNSTHVTIDNCFVSNNGAGIYIQTGASYNNVRNCLATKNGNLPWWEKGDRPGIGIGGNGPNTNNTIEDNEISYNGGPYSDPGLIAYDAPNTILRNNNVHHNYGFGLFVTIGSNHSIVRDNKIVANGIPATKAKLKGMAGMAIRHSNNVLVENNQILNNHVSSDSRWRGAMLGPKGGLDVRGHSKQNMTNLRIINNVISGTIGGPNIYIDRIANLTGLVISPSAQAPSWYKPPNNH